MNHAPDPAEAAGKPATSPWTTESLNRTVMREAHREIAELADRQLALLSGGLPLAGDGRLLVRWQEVVLVGTAQVYNSLRAAWELAFVGYAPQALALARYAFEWMLLARHVEQHRGEAQAWLDAIDKPPKRAGELADQLFGADAQTDASVRELHKVLHRFSHVDPIGLAAVLRHDGDVGQLSYGARPDDAQLLGAAYILLIIGIVSMEPLQVAGAGISAPWTKQLDECRTQLDPWLKRAETDLAAAGSALLDVSTTEAKSDSS